MAYTIQNCVDDVSFELRLLLDGTSGAGADFNLISRWVDQVHKDVLYNSVFRHMIRASTTVTSVAGTRSYAITPTDIYRVLSVYDQASESYLSPMEETLNPSRLADPVDKTAGTARPGREVAEHRSSGLVPEYYWLQTVVTAGTPAHTLYISPSPGAAEHAGVIQVRYSKLVTTVSGAATALTMGDAGRSVMVAGVLAQAYAYLHNAEKAAQWQAVYERRKLGDTI